MAFSGISNYSHPAFGGAKKRRLDAQNVIGQFAEGDSVLVYFEPENPRNSKIKVGPTWDIFIRLSLACTIIMILGFLAGASKISFAKK